MSVTAPLEMEAFMTLLTEQTNLPPMILASGSPRRKELLTSLGFTFEVKPPTVDEAAIAITGLTPSQVVEKLAMEKGQSIAEAYPDHLVIGADTIVVLDEQILGKPVDTADAARMLGQLGGTEHTVVTGVAVFYKGEQVVAHSETRVWMRALSRDDIEAYIASGEPMDKAGAYAIQGLGSTLVERIDGCYFNVVGLSLILTTRLMQQVLKQS